MEAGSFFLGAKLPLGTTPQRIPPQREYFCIRKTVAHENDCNTYGRRQSDVKMGRNFSGHRDRCALLGFTGIAGAAADIAKFLFFLFIAIFVIIFLLAIFAGKQLF